MEQALSNSEWKTIILKAGEGEKILFRIGLMTFKACSSTTDNHFMICETVLPPGANVAPHAHPEAETFYILEGEFVFFIQEMDEEIVCGVGSFISVPPHVQHAFKNNTSQAGKILGMMMPGGASGLESMFRQFGVAIEQDQVPDLNKPVGQLVEYMAQIRPHRE
jgi:quercetin dioxygenase-like cupin family protein